MQEQQMKEVKTRLAEAKAITILTGAGISADSGVPTFRGTDGLWKNFSAQDLANPEAFARDPRLVWQWYNWRRELIADKEPNPAHYAIAELERGAPAFWLVTQNVDGLHAAAGSTHLSEIHGNIWKVRCTQCDQITDNRDVPIAILPTCHTCQGLLRPHIVWFGESLDPQVLSKSLQAIQQCDVLLIVGTSGIVYPAASFAPMAKQSGAMVVEVNLDPPPSASYVDVYLQGRAKDLVPALVADL